MRRREVLGGMVGGLTQPTKTPFSFSNSVIFKVFIGLPIISVCIGVIEGNNGKFKSYAFFLKY